MSKKRMAHNRRKRQKKKELKKKQILEKGSIIDDVNPKESEKIKKENIKKSIENNKFAKVEQKSGRILGIVSIAFSSFAVVFLLIFFNLSAILTFFGGLFGGEEKPELINPRFDAYVNVNQFYKVDGDLDGAPNIRLREEYIVYQREGVTNELEYWEGSLESSKLLVDGGTTYIDTYTQSHFDKDVYRVTFFTRDLDAMKELKSGLAYSELFFLAVSDIPSYDFAYDEEIEEEVGLERAKKSLEEAITYHKLDSSPMNSVRFKGDAFDFRDKVKLYLLNGTENDTFLKQMETELNKKVLELSGYNSFFEFVEPESENVELNLISDFEDGKISGGGILELIEESGSLKLKFYDALSYNALKNVLRSMLDSDLKSIFDLELDISVETVTNEDMYDYGDESDKIFESSFIYIRDTNRKHRDEYPFDYYDDMGLIYNNNKYNVKTVKTLLYTGSNNKDITFTFGNKFDVMGKTKVSELVLEKDGDRIIPVLIEIKEGRVVGYKYGKDRNGVSNITTQLLLRR